MRRKLVALAVTLSLAAIIAVPRMAMAEEVPRITKEEVKGMLGNADLIIIDVRTEEGWSGSELRIKGAVREDPENVNSWMNKYPKDKTLVFY